MAFIKRTWLARIGLGLNKFIIGAPDGQGKQTLTNSPDSVTQQGDVISADNLNDLEGRIETAFTGVDTALTGIDTDLTNLSGNFAQIETTPSTHNYSVGDMLVFNGILYKVTTAIATNDALVVGSNIQAQTVASAISDINNLTYLGNVTGTTGTQLPNGWSCVKVLVRDMSGSDKNDIVEFDIEKQMFDEVGKSELFWHSGSANTYAYFELSLNNGIYTALLSSLRKDGINQTSTAKSYIWYK